MNNKDWIDFLSNEWHVSRTSAREMLHALMVIKREDNFKKLFNKDNAKKSLIKGD